MYRIVLGLVLVASTARADDAPFHPAPGTAVTASFVGHATQIGSENEGGMGGSLELALGSGRWQYFVEATASSADARPMVLHPETQTTGFLGRGGAGVRWLARQFQLDPSAGIELYLEAVTGIERYWWEHGGQLTRPDVGAGVGFQVRWWEFRGLTVRMGTRVVFAPSDRDATLVSCHGTGCPVGTSTSVAGLMVNLGVAW